MGLNAYRRGCGHVLFLHGGVLLVLKVWAFVPRWRLQDAEFQLRCATGALSFIRGRSSSSAFTACMRTASGRCSGAGGVVWSSSAPSTMSVSGSGVATWTGIREVRIPLRLGTFSCPVGRFRIPAAIMGQHPGDVFHQYPTPDFRQFQDPGSDAMLPLDVAAGSKVTIGSGIWW